MNLILKFDATVPGDALDEKDVAEKLALLFSENTELRVLEMRLDGPTLVTPGGETRRMYISVNGEAYLKVPAS